MQARSMRSRGRHRLDGPARLRVCRGANGWQLAPLRPAERVAAALVRLGRALTTVGPLSAVLRGLDALAAPSLVAR